MPLLGFDNGVSTWEMEEGKLTNGKKTRPNMTSRKILSTGILVGVILTALLGGLALVVRALRNMEINLRLKKDDRAKQEF